MRRWRNGALISKQRYCATRNYGKADGLYRIQIHATADVWQIFGGAEYNSVQRGEAQETQGIRVLQPAR